MSDNVFSAEVFYIGRVQGVGFRYSTLQVAKEFDVSGFVRNLADGRVHLVVEGDEVTVKAFLAELDDRLDNFIRDRETHEKTGARQHKSFEIVR